MPTKISPRSPYTSETNLPDVYIPAAFTRHNLHLHTLLVENQAWFSASDLGRLMSKHLDERMTRKLDPDQRRMMRGACPWADRRTSDAERVGRVCVAGLSLLS